MSARQVRVVGVWHLCGSGHLGQIEWHFFVFSPQHQCYFGFVGYKLLLHILS